MSPFFETEPKFVDENCEKSHISSGGTRNFFLGGGIEGAKCIYEGMPPPPVGVTIAYFKKKKLKLGYLFSAKMTP